MRKHTLDFEVQKLLYEPDELMQGKYQSFSAELLRLALLFLTAYGYIFWELTKPAAGRTLPLEYLDSNEMQLFGLGLLLIALAASTALAHRALSTSGFDRRLYYGRLQTRIADKLTSVEKNCELIVEAEREHRKMRRLYYSAGVMVRLSSIFLGFAVVTTAMLGVSVAMRQ